MFEPKGNEMTGCWRKPHNEEFHNLYSSPSIIKMIKSSRMRCTGHVAPMGQNIRAYKFLVEKSEEDNYDGLGIEFFTGSTAPFGPGL
jgi:hypothetical protein